MPKRLECSKTIIKRNQALLGRVDRLDRLGACYGRGRLHDYCFISLSQGVISVLRYDSRPWHRIVWVAPCFSVCKERYCTLAVLAG